MGSVELDYLHRFQDRHGKWRHYYRRGGKRQAIKGDPGSPEFMAHYQRIHESFQAADKTATAAEGTFGFLVERYYAAHAYRRLEDSTKAEYRRHIEPMRERWAGIKLIGITKKVAVAYRDTLEDHPTTANAAFAMLGRLFNFAMEKDWAAANPTATVKPLRVDSDGWPPWTEAQIDRFKRDSEGAARMAFYLALYAGQRRGDVLAFRWDAIKDGAIEVRQAKTGAELTIPIHPELDAELAAERARQIERAKARGKDGKPVGIGLTIVQKLDGLPYTKHGFWTIWRREQERLAGGIFHGLRKNATNNLYEAGCTPQEVQAITGHESLEMVQHYGKKANQKRMAQSAMRKLTGTKQDANADRNGKPS